MSAESAEPQEILGVTITLEQIKDKIKMLSTYEGFTLTAAATDLQKALHINPEASNLLLPEELGAAVAILMKIKNVVIAEASVKKTIKDSKKYDFSDPATMKLIDDDL